MHVPAKFHHDRLNGCGDIANFRFPEGFEVCANGLIVVKITVAVGGKSGNKTAKINVKKFFDLLLSTRNTFCGTWYLPHSRVHKSIAELCSNFGDSAITKGQIAYFLLRMHQTALFLLPVKNLTSPSCSPTPISYNTREFWRYVNI